MLFNLLSGDGGNNIAMYIIFGVIILAFIGMSVFQNKQRKKQAAEDQERKSKLCVGTKIITIGGIMGTVVSVNHEENSFVLESEGSNIKLDKRSIYQMQLPEGAEATANQANEVQAQPTEENK